MARGKRNDPSTEPTPEDCAYAAGFIDGEGCITVRGQRRQYLEEKGWQVSPYVIVMVSQVAPRPLQWMQARWGGSLRQLFRRRKPDERDAWEWGCSSQKAYRLITDIRPWLRCKGAQADNAMRLQPLRKARGWHQGLSEEEIDVHNQIIAEARRLNQERPTWHELPVEF